MVAMADNEPVADVSSLWHPNRMMAFWLLLLFFLPALILWSPAFVFAYWLANRGKARRYIWVWAWVLTASVTVALLGLTGCIGDVFGSV